MLLRLSFFCFKQFKIHWNICVSILS